VPAPVGQRPGPEFKFAARASESHV
jgi:hypothetical protein